MSMSNYLENKIQEHVLRNISYVSPTTVYVALYTSDPTDADTGAEVTATSYARQTITFGASANGICANSSIVTFPIANESWGTISHVGIRDALTGGNLLYSGTLSSSQTVGINNQVVFNTSQISISLD